MAAFTPITRPAGSDKAFSAKERPRRMVMSRVFGISLIRHGNMDVGRSTLNASGGPQGSLRRASGTLR